MGVLVDTPIHILYIHTVLVKAKALEIIRRFTVYLVDALIRTHTHVCTYIHTYYYYKWYTSVHAIHTYTNMHSKYSILTTLCDEPVQRGEPLLLAFDLRGHRDVLPHCRVDVRVYFELRNNN